MTACCRFCMSMYAEQAKRYGMLFLVFFILFLILFKSKPGFFHKIYLNHRLHISSNINCMGRYIDRVEGHEGLVGETADAHLQSSCWRLRYGAGPYYLPSSPFIIVNITFNSCDSISFKAEVIESM